MTSDQRKSALGSTDTAPSDARCCNPDCERLGTLDIHDAHDPDVVTLARADVKALLGLLLWVHDSILRQPDNDALLRRVGAAMGRLP